MFSSILAALLSFEIGAWFGFGASKFGSKARNQHVFTSKYSSPRSIPAIDSVMERQTLRATEFQRDIAARISKVIRSIVNTRAFELMVLMHLSRAWPGQKEIPAEVKLF